MRSKKSCQPSMGRDSCTRAAKDAASPPVIRWLRPLICRPSNRVISTALEALLRFTGRLASTRTVARQPSKSSSITRLRVRLPPLLVRMMMRYTSTCPSLIQIVEPSENQRASSTRMVRVSPAVVLLTNRVGCCHRRPAATSPCTDPCARSAACSDGPISPRATKSSSSANCSKASSPRMAAAVVPAEPLPIETPRRAPPAPGRRQRGRAKAR